MELPDESRQHMRGLQVVIIIGPIQIGRHGANKIAAKLSPVSLAKLDPGNFGDGIPFIRWLKGAGEEVFLFERLRGEFGINAGTAQKQQLFYSRPEGSPNQIVLNL